MAKKINTLVLKIASRCNLNCKYCYMYNVGDTTFKNQPKFMSHDIIDKVFDHVLKHCLANDIKDYHFTLHGGEPLLASKALFYYFKDKAEETLGKNGINYEFVLQTNGLLLNEDWCNLFNELDIIVGISLDGLKVYNDSERIDHKGNGSYDRIVHGINVGKKYLDLPPGILSVININSPALETYKHFCDLNITHLDLLIPDANYDTPPPQPTEWSSETPYADWLIEVFDYWFQQKNEDRIEIRLFETLMHSILGGEFNSDGFGNLENQVLLVETDGSIEVVGSLKMCGHGFTKRGANVYNNDFESALTDNLSQLYYNASQYLSPKCQSCIIKDTCGGGHLVQRYSKAKGFNNHSVYCNDYKKLITHMQNKIIEHIPAKYLDKIEYDLVTYESIKDHGASNTMDSYSYIELLESFKYNTVE